MIHGINIVPQEILPSGVLDSEKFHFDTISTVLEGSRCGCRCGCGCGCQCTAAGSLPNLLAFLCEVCIP